MAQPLADPEDVRAHLVAAARAGIALTYGELLEHLGYGFSRPKMRQLCATLGAIDREGQKHGEPELAVLVVRQADGIPGQGWWIAGGGRQRGYEGPWEGPQAARFIAALQSETFSYWRTAYSRHWRRTGGNATCAAMSSPVRQFTVSEEDDGIRLDRWFRRNLPEASFGTVARWARTGQLRLDGRRATPGDRIEAGQTIRVPPRDGQAKPGRLQAEREPLSPDEIEFVRSLVIHDDPAAIVLVKPPGLATQGGTKTKEHLDRLLDGLVDDEGSRPKLVHRLDKDTSGVLLVARTARAAAFFSKAFSGRTARKVYWAIVVGVPSVEDGLIDLPLAKQPGTGGEKMHVDEAVGQPARTRYRVIERAGNRAAWVELQPLTGRTHQLRVHMEAIGHPILGDGKYAGQDAFLTGAVSRKLHLHARRLRIDHPDGGRIDVTADLPEHFRDSLATLGFDPALGDLPLDEVRFSQTTEGKRRAAAAAAKSRRKERRGERRSRSRN